MDSSTIMAVLLDKRTDAASTVQEILTRYGSIIGTRIGLHQFNDTEEGLILLHLNGGDNEIEELERDLSELNRVKVEKMTISFDD